MKIFVSAGEVSGDVILGKILHQYRICDPVTFSSLTLQGLGGERAMAFGLKPLFSMRDMAVNGIGDVLFRPFFLWQLYKQTLAVMFSFAPDLVMLIDYPGLNLRLAHAARKKNLKVLYIAPPQTWAYKNSSSRNRRMALALQGCAVHALFPFEVAPFEGIAKSVSVGHFYVTDTEGLPRREVFPPIPILGLFPGSRLAVLKRNLPIWTERLNDLGYLDSIQVQIVVPNHLVSEVTFLLQNFFSHKTYAHRINKIQVRSNIDVDYSNLNYAIAYPGSVTMELALNGVPTLVLAVVDSLTLLVGRRILAFPQWLSLPNLLLKKSLFPEWSGSVTSITKIKFGKLVSNFLQANGASQTDWKFVHLELQSNMGDADGAEKVCQVLKKELAS